MAYTSEDLLVLGEQPLLQGRCLDEVAFPLGGIGTGSICIGGWGQLRDWEVRNRPAKGFRPPHCFFTIKVQEGTKAPVTRVLQGPAGGPRATDGHSAPRGGGEGLPHFREVAFRGEYPVANVYLSDPTMPVRVTLEAWNPFIPLNDKDSGIPAAFLCYHVVNVSSKSVKVTLFGNLANFIGQHDGRTNRARVRRGLSGLYCSHDKLDPSDPEFGTLALVTPGEEALVWARCQHDSLAKWWDTIAYSDVFPPEDGNSDLGTIAVRFTLQPGEKAAVPFVLSWHFPVFEHWEKPKPPSPENAEGGIPARWRNYYATLWKDAWDVAIYAVKNWGRLWKENSLFHDLLFESTLPPYVLDAISSQLSILKSPTCLRLENGTFYGFEGCSNTQGCCEGSCTHVWNYAQALAYLFPALQRSMRDADWANCLQEDGYVTFRLPLPLGTPGKPDFHPAADGQMGTVMQVYREWQLSGDEDWLRRTWPRAKKALEFAWRYWDADRDGVMEGMQHNTYDIEFYGPNTMTGSLYLGALRAAEEIARHLGEEEKASEYAELFARGSAWTDAYLFNGEYYEQQVNPDAHLAWPERQRQLAERHGRDDKFDWPKWQFGKGCLSDQLIGQWYATMLGLGYLYHPKNISRTLRSIFRYNWKEQLHDHPGLLRLYAINDEAGLLLCTWPRGERPGDAFYFADEVWCGVEYQVASHMIYEGMVEEGLAIVKGVRERYTGEFRNPWDEIECGHHYARSLASYALLTALSGFHYSAPAQRMRFSPRVFERDFRTFFCVEDGWGSYRQKVGKKTAKFTLAVHYGGLTLRELAVAPIPAKPRRLLVTLGGHAVPADCTFKKGQARVTFGEPALITPRSQLQIRCTF